MQRTVIGLITIALAVTAVPAFAQTDGRNELSVLAGMSLLDVTSHDLRGVPRGRRGLTLPFGNTRTTSLDDSVELGVRYGRDISERIAVEADFSIAPGHELRDRLGFDCPPPMFCIAGPEIALFAPDILTTDRVIAYHYGGGVRVDLTEGDITPALIAGVGGVAFSGDDFSETDLALRLGGALRVSFNALNVRVEVVDVIVADHFVTKRAEHDLHIRVGFGVRW